MNSYELITYMAWYICSFHFTDLNKIAWLLLVLYVGNPCPVTMCFYTFLLNQVYIFVNTVTNKIAHLKFLNSHNVKAFSFDDILLRIIVILVFFWTACQDNFSGSFICYHVSMITGMVPTGSQLLFMIIKDYVYDCNL